jgi:arylsulfatase A-like enzyme
VALITGRYQYRLRLGLEEPLTGKPDIGLDPAHPTLPSLLKQAGYSSTLVGKWHLGVLPKFGPLKSGYDHFYGFRGGAVDYYTHRNGANKADLWDDDVPVEHTGYMTELLGNRAVEVVKRYAKSKQPFMLSLHFNAPHWPWEAPGDEAEADRLSKAGGSLGHSDGGTQQTYYRMIEAMDRQIGRVRQALETNGLTENTIVIFTSDNGGERFSDTWPFSGKKTELLEGGLRIPSIISWPARIRAGGTTEQVAISMDWVPTLLAAANTMPDAAYPSPIPRRLFWRYKAHGQRAIRDGDLKFIKLRENTFLFNVVNDPLERANLKDRQKDDYTRLAREWHRWNAAMLPEIAESFSGANDGAHMADHIGTPAASQEPDHSFPPDD